MNRKKLHDIIFEADTPKGKLFDVVLLWAIVLSVVVVMLESVPDIKAEYGPLLRYIEYFFTGLFTIEYILRIVAVKRKSGYIFSFYGVIDLMTILPTFVELFIPGAASLMVIRVLRLMRVVRVLKLVSFIQEASVLKNALWGARNKILLFLGSTV